MRPSWLNALPRSHISSALGSKWHHTKVIPLSFFPLRIEAWRWISTMRLINTWNLELQEFNEMPPRYAILSHTWGNEEVSFQDFQNGRARKKGFSKITETCRLARLEGIPYAWIDTCCIDKTSSAELTQAINSMFRWYADSTVCFAYLDDLVLGDAPQQSASIAFASSRWFTRGWTLQELIAPRNLKFYDSKWRCRGTKADLSAILAFVTRIDQEVLCDNSALFTLLVATRMSWAVRRQTTREEDMAYCLLGIFDVNIPAIYGEGKKAFIRLQEEIARQTNDLTLFAWKQLDTAQTYRGIFARAPDEFIDSWDIVPNTDRRFNEEFGITNKGIRINGDLGQSSSADYFFGLGCSHAHAHNQQIGIYLKHHGADLYARQLPHHLPVRKEPPFPASVSIYIDKNIDTTMSKMIERGTRYGIRLRHGFDDVVVASAQPLYVWDRRNKMFLIGGGRSSFAGVLYLRSERWTGDIVIIYVLLLQGGVPLVKFIDSESIDNVVDQPHNIPNLPDTALYERVSNLKLSVELNESFEQEPVFSVDMQNLDTVSHGDAEQKEVSSRVIPELCCALRCA
jgi:hypothetical protein